VRAAERVGYLRQARDLPLPAGGSALRPRGHVRDDSGNMISLTQPFAMPS